MIVVDKQVVNGTVESGQKITCLSPTLSDLSPQNRNVNLFFVSPTPPQNVQPTACPGVVTKCQSFNVLLYPEWTDFGTTTRGGGLLRGIVYDVSAGPNNEISPMSPMVTIRGFGFDELRKYQCQFSELPDTTLGFPSPINTSGLILSSTLALCAAPVQPARFPNSVTLLDFQEADALVPGSFISVFTQLSLNATQFTFFFANINKRPSFSGTSIVLSHSLDQGQEVMIAQWAQNIWEGTFQDGSRVLAETSQNVTFWVTCDMCDKAMNLKIHANGSLSLVPPDAGFFALTVFLKDDGGNAYGGMDTSETQTFALETARDYSNTASYNKGSTPEIIANILTVSENAEQLNLYVFNPFLIKPPFQPTGPVFVSEASVVESLDIFYDGAYFSPDNPPTVKMPDGMLSFKVRPFVFGNTSVMLQKKGT
jgi:hypothetical protein